MVIESGHHTRLFSFTLFSIDRTPFRYNPFHNKSPNHQPAYNRNYTSIFHNKATNGTKMKTILYLSVAYPPKDGRDFQLMFSGLFETWLKIDV